MPDAVSDRQPIGVMEVAVDIGGTFTDLVCLGEDGRIHLGKIPSTRGNESEAVATALELMARDWGLRPQQIARFVHGTTVATNAVLERQGARIGLLATEGFRDILEIGRQYRTDMYNLFFEPNAPVFLVPGQRRKGVSERISATGGVVVPLDEDSVRRAVQELLAEGVDAIAVCYLFSFLNPAHERRTAELIAEIAPDIAVSLSSMVDPSFREYERTCITAFDAYIKPVLSSYLLRIEHILADAGMKGPFQVMQSRGGIGRAGTVSDRPVRLFLSGPAAGVIGGQAVGQALGLSELITVDIGGTSSDIALISGGKPAVRSEGIIDGYPVRVPMLDVNAVGAGGGSIAWLDDAGSLRVGPRSAGAVPGPACYGRGGEAPTVTDASVVLGYIDPAYFAGGTVPLKPELAHAAIRQKIAEPLGMSVEQAALGIHRIINAQMAEGIRLVTVRRGVDPRGYALVCLGGGGPLHATALAGELAMTRIVVPLYPGVLSAAGLLAAPIEHELSSGQQKRLAAMTLPDLRAAFAELDLGCAALIQAEQWPGAVEIRHSADVCYVGQSYYLEIEVDLAAEDALERLYRDFLAAHDRAHGHAVDGALMVANLRTTHRSPARRSLDWRYRPTGGDARKGSRAIVVQGHGRLQATVYDRMALQPGATLAGPSIVEQTDTTLLVPPGWQASVADNGSLLLNAE
jgi:N-methylhydantoinase A/oxoprolinase/acetone carboxylase beta subunit